MIFVGKIQSWLHDMADDGLILKRLRLYHAIFEESEPADIDYRVVALGEDYLTDEREKELKANDWELINGDIGIGLFNFLKKIFVQTINYFVFKSTVPDNSRDLHGDLVDTSWLYRKYKIERKKINVELFITIFGTISSIWILTLELGSSYSLLYITTKMAIGIFCFLLTIIFFGERNRIKGLKKVYENIEPISTKQKWQIDSRKNRVISIIRFACIVVAVQAYLSIELDGFFYYMPNCVEFYDRYISVSDIEGYGYILDDEQIEKPRIRKSNTSLFGGPFGGPIITTYANVFLPVYYEVSNSWSGKTIDGISLDAYYHIYYYNSTLTFLHSMAYDNWVDSWDGDKWIGGELQFFTTDYFQEIAYCYLDGGRMYICMYSNNEFINLYYEGGKSPEELVEAIAYALINQ